jgi:uncharacterized protein (TIGR02145 family)
MNILFKMKKVFLVSVLVLLVAGIGAYAQERTMQLYKGNTVVAEYKVSEIDSVKFVEKTTPDEVGVEINGIRWATRNVDAPGAFAENPEDAGMFYQWNRKVGWSSTDPLVNSNGETTWDSSVPSGTEWEKVNDPCPAGWRVPSLDELQSLVSSGYQSTTQNGVNGTLFGSAPNTVFLPAAGYRGASSSKLFNDSRGYFWSSTQYNSDYAYRLGFGSGYASSTDVTGRLCGYSVRCVAE